MCTYCGQEEAGYIPDGVLGPTCGTCQEEASDFGVEFVDRRRMTRFPLFPESHHWRTTRKSASSIPPTLLAGDSDTRLPLGPFPYLDQRVVHTALAQGRGGGPAERGDGRV